MGRVSGDERRRKVAYHKGTDFLIWRIASRGPRAFNGGDYPTAHISAYRVQVGKNQSVGYDFSEEEE